MQHYLHIYHSKLTSKIDQIIQKYLISLSITKLYDAVILFLSSQSDFMII